MTKRPRIETNEGPPDKHVSITTNVVLYPDSTYPVVLAPFGVSLGQWGDTTTLAAEFTITNVSPLPLTPSIVAAEDDYFSVDLPASIAPGHSARARVVLTPEGLARSFDKSFTFEFNDPAGTRFTMPVRRVIRPAAEPPSLAGTPEGCD